MGLFDFLKKPNNPVKGKPSVPRKEKRYHQAGIRKLDKELAYQDAQISKIHEAERQYEQDKDIVALTAFWEGIWENGGLLFNGSKWTFRLPDLYIQQKQYDDALRIVKKIKNPAYRDKTVGYINKIQKLKAKQKQ